MREDGFYKASLGMTTLEEVVRVVMHSENEASMPRTAGEIIRLCTGEQDEPPLDELVSEVDRILSEEASRDPEALASMEVEATPIDLSAGSGAEERPVPHEAFQGDALENDDDSIEVAEESVDLGSADLMVASPTPTPDPLPEIPHEARAPAAVAIEDAPAPFPPAMAAEPTRETQ